MTISIERRFHLATQPSRRGGSRVTVRRGEAPPPEPEAKPPERIPRISRLMALAIHYQHLLDTGVVPDASTLARLAGVTQPRMTQILNLNLLAPDIQERLLYGSLEVGGAETIRERHLRKLISSIFWPRQRDWWMCCKDPGARMKQL